MQVEERKYLFLLNRDLLLNMNLIEKQLGFQEKAVELVIVKPLLASGCNVSISGTNKNLLVTLITLNLILYSTRLYILFKG